MVFSPGGSRILAASDDGVALILDAATGETLTRLAEHDGPVTSAVFSPDGSHVVTTGADRRALVRNLLSDTVLELRGHTGVIHRAAVSKDGQLIITASDDRTARVWSFQDGRVVAELRDHTGPVNAAAFSPDSRNAITACEDKIARIFVVDARASVEDLLRRARTQVTRELTAEERQRYVHPRPATFHPDDVPLVWAPATA